MPTAATVVAEMLARAGVRYAYTVPGESFLGLLDALERHPELELVSTRHESGAGFMADASARLSGVPAVALASRGPGASNLAIAVHTARQDATPMVVLLGQVSTAAAGREAFQEVDLAAMFGPLAGWVGVAGTAAEVPALLEQALLEAVTGRPGPAVLVLPTDLLDVPVPAPPRPPAPPADVAAPDGIEPLAARLTGARRPVLVAGRGVAAASPLLVQVAERFGAGVYVAFRCQDRFPVDHPGFLGHLGLVVPDDVLRAVREADLVVSLGARWDEVTSQEWTVPAPGAHHVALGRFDPAAHHGVGGQWLPGDADRLLRDLLAHAPAGPPDRSWAEAHDAVDAWSRPPAAAAVTADGLLDPARVVAALVDALPDPAVVTNDAGNFAAFLHRYWRFGPGVRQLAPANGAMGFGVPAGVAAAQAGPGGPVVSVVGDGGALMTGQEIETAVRLGLDLTVLVVQNRMYGTIAMHQARATGRAAAVGIGEVDFTAWARGLGARACTVTTENDLAAALTDAIARPGVALVAARTDPDLVAPSSRLSALAAAHHAGDG